LEPAAARGGNAVAVWRSGTAAALVKEWSMANLTLVYGMRLLPADEVASVGDAPIALKNGNDARVTMHILEGSREEIEAQLRLSIDAFFDFYPEI
jgi:hypothetical protein